MVKCLIVSSDFGYREILGKSLIDIVIEKNKEISDFFVLVNKSLFPKYKEKIISKVVYVFDDDKDDLARYLNNDDTLIVLYDDYFIEEEISVDDIVFEDKRYGYISCDGVKLNSLLDFQKLRQKLIVKRNAELIDKGVDIVDVYNTFIDYDSDVKEGTVIHPNTVISSSIIGKNCDISGRIIDSVVKDFVVIDNSVVEDAIVEDDVNVGPVSYIHDECILKKDCKVGSYVELKKSVIGNGSKIKHQSVLLDCCVGDEVNVGAGVITANYDGEMKHITKIGNKAFVGCNSVLVAPVSIGEKSFIAADTTVVKNVGDNEFSISRIDQIVKVRKKMNI